MMDTKTPKIRFNGFSGPWKKVKFGEITKDGMYGMNSSAVDYDGKHKYIRITDIDEITRKYNPDPLTSPQGKIERKYKLEKGDLVFARTGASTGKTYLYNSKDGDLYFAGFLIKFRISDNDPFFVFQHTLTAKYDKWVKVMSMRSGQPGINSEEFKTFELYTPSLPEQQKIASFLSAVDERIELLERKKEKLEAYKKGVMQQIFSQQIRFKQDDGSEFPDWEEKRLGEVLKIGSGKDYKHLGNGNIPVFGTGGLMTYVDDFLYEGESVGIGRKGTIDKPMFLKGKFWTVDTLFYTHSFKQIVPRFVYLVFQTINWKVHNEASGVPSLSKTTIEKLQIMLPSTNEQLKIVAFTEEIQNSISNLDSQIQGLRTWKKGLLQQMFV
ncbi:restriction endonuclease subunit S [Cecembia rubra]|uniref:Type I restriction enzyme S subunit n=1 Tax=Cecembia rubra TaxID=1485585 RepID=A0A2P8E342_9BACT|nr:restriction endonuclease subunit S [Cecembia rubra]PSL03827.1 type I restriction enzyme S subunit [Cecembia rubra]